MCTSNPTPATAQPRAIHSDRFAFTVARLIGQQELVTRPLPPEIADGSALSGGAVMSDGQIALIVDCDAVVDVPVSA